MHDWELVWKSGKTDKSIKRSGIIVRASSELEANEKIMKEKIDLLYRLLFYGNYRLITPDLDKLIIWFNKMFKSNTWQDNSDKMSDERLFMMKV